jgi:hypothetical protein
MDFNSTPPLAPIIEDTLIGQFEQEPRTLNDSRIVSNDSHTASDDASDDASDADNEVDIDDSAQRMDIMHLTQWPQEQCASAEPSAELSAELSVLRRRMRTGKWAKLRRD